MIPPKATGKERRKTAEINESFREFLTKTLSEVLGFPVGDRMAITIFKAVMRSPLRFLMSLEEHELDQYGDRSLAVSSVGKFKIIPTVPLGGKIKLVGEEGKYPRYKFYPASSMESLVEVLSGIADDTSKSVVTKMEASEEYNATQNIMDMADYFRKLMEQYGIEVSKETSKESPEIESAKTVLKALVKLGLEDLTKGVEDSKCEDPYPDEDLDMEFQKPKRVVKKKEDTSQVTEPPFDPMSLKFNN